MSQFVCKIDLPQSKDVEQKGDKHHYTIKKKQDPSDVAIKLEILKQISSCLLLNEWFVVEFSIAIDFLGKVSVSEQNSDATLRVQNFIELSAVLRSTNDSRSNEILDSEYELVVDKSSTSTLSFSEQPSAEFNAKFRCKIVGPTTLKNNSTNLFRINIFNSNKVSFGESEQICTAPFCLTPYKLVLENYDWDDHWYKDEGGRDKCMQVQIGLYNYKGSPVYGERVNLTFNLLYDTYELHSKVLKQDILQILGPTSHFISPNSSQATVRFRIKDVSKNHQGQSFKIEILASPIKDNLVAPVCSPPVSVRSKRNKKQRTSKIATSTSPRTISPTFPSPPTQSPHLNTHTRVSSPQIISGQSEYLDLSTNSKSISQGLDRINDVTGLREAMKGVIKWTEEVVNGLYPLQWQPVGYAQFPDGTPNYNCPHHSMQNPNDTISKLLTMYADSSRDQLRVILNAVENTKHNQESDQRIIEISSSDSDESIQHQPTRNIAVANAPSLFQRDSSYPKVQHFHPRNPYKALHMSNSASAPSQFPIQVARGKNNPSMHGNECHNHHQMSMLYQSPVCNRNRTVSMDTTSHPGHGYSQDIQHNSTSSNIQKKEKDTRNLQEDIAFIVAMQYISPMNGSSFGLPAYCVSKEILGFYRESSENAGVTKFISISKLEYEFGTMEKLQADRFFTEAMERNRDAVYSKEDWGTLSNLVDQAMVYDWNSIPSDDTNSLCLSPENIFP